MALTSKDFQSIVTKRKVKVDIDLSESLQGLSQRQGSQLKRLVGDTLINEIASSTLKKTSPVNQSGSQAYKKLSKDYRKKKLADGKGGQPNLRLEDKMINDIFQKNETSGTSLNITNDLSKKKAENHNHGVTVPKRQYLPTKNGQAFTRNIMKVVNQAIRDFKKENKA